MTIISILLLHALPAVPDSKCLCSIASQSLLLLLRTKSHMRSMQPSCWQLKSCCGGTSQRSLVKACRVGSFAPAAASLKPLHTAICCTLAATSSPQLLLTLCCLCIVLCIDAVKAVTFSDAQCKSMLAECVTECRQMLNAAESHLRFCTACKHTKVILCNMQEWAAAYAPG